MCKTLTVVILLTLCACKKPAGTVIADWTYEGDDAGRTQPRAFNPPKIVTSETDWPTSKGTTKLKFETEKRPVKCAAVPHHVVSPRAAQNAP
jgi:hypothetical protein